MRIRAPERWLLAGLSLAGCYQTTERLRPPRGEWSATAEPAEGAVCVTGEAGLFCSVAFETDPAAREELCWDGRDVTGPGPAAEAFVTVEQIAGLRTRHALVTFASWFVDNTFGDHSSSGWGKHGDKLHRFEDLVDSDHLRMTWHDGRDAPFLDLRLDYLSPAPGAPSGYASLGPFGGEGAIFAGPASAVVASRTSLDRNLNERDCRFVDSSPDGGECPEWEEHVVYELWVEEEAFGAAGPGTIAIESVHASPSRSGGNTVEVDPCR